MTAIKIILLAALGAFTGFRLGKGGIDSLVDANVKGFFLRCVYAVIFLIAAALFAVLDKELRLGWVLDAALSLAAFIFGFFYFPLVVPQKGMKVKWNSSVGTVCESLNYDETRPECSYDLYLPAEKTPDGTYPLMLYIHGGGFSAGDKKDGAVWCKYMTAKGFVSVSMNYTLVKEGQESNLPLMASQALRCVEAVKEKCSGLGYDLTEMTVSGGSAGGAIALLFAYSLGKSSPVPLKFVFQQTGPVCFEPTMWGNVNYDYAGQAVSVSAFSGQRVTEEMVKSGEHIAIVKAISPSYLVDENTVPTLSAYGPRDKMVPVQLKYLLFTAFERHNVPYDYIEYPHSNHGLYDDPEAQRVFLKKLDEYCDKYLEHKLQHVPGAGGHGAGRGK